MKKNFKRITAMALATMMVIGSAMTVMASGDDNTTPAVKTSGSSEGEGTSEGHVLKKKTAVTLPTVAENTFAYTMDPEGLIQATAKKAYGDNATFPASEQDTGVYFQTASTAAVDNYTEVTAPNVADIATYYEKDDTKDPATYALTEDTTLDDSKTYYTKSTTAATSTFANASNDVTVTNESSHAIKLTVKAEVVSESTDIPLVIKDKIKGNTTADPQIEKADKASLYLGLKVDSNDADAILKDKAVTKEVTLAGKEDYFKVDYDTTKKEYIYRVMSVEEVNANKAEGAEDISELAWATSSFHLEGAVTSGLDIESTTTAPKVKLTWSWVDPEANIAPSIATTDYTATANNPVVIPVSLGMGDLAATGVTSFGWIRNGSETKLNSDNWSFDANTQKITFAARMVNAISGENTFKVTFNDDAATTVTITITK